MCDRATPRTQDLEAKVMQTILIFDKKKETPAHSWVFNFPVKNTMCVFNKYMCTCYQTISCFAIVDIQVKIHLRVFNFPVHIYNTGKNPFTRFNFPVCIHNV